MIVLDVYMRPSRLGSTSIANAGSNWGDCLRCVPDVT